MIVTGNGYETFSPSLRKKILETLNYYDSYEGKKGSHLLPDHKFPEIRWDEHTKAENPDDMTETDIKEKFQLLTNQRNLQKREVCRRCYHTNERGYPFGIKFFYEGTEKWDENIPKRGKAAEEGCKGCGWYDMGKWRSVLTESLAKYGD